MLSGWWKAPGPSPLGRSTFSDNTLRDHAVVHHGDHYGDIIQYVPESRKSVESTSEHFAGRMEYNESRFLERAECGLLRRMLFGNDSGHGSKDALIRGGVLLMYGPNGTGKSLLAEWIVQNFRDR